MKKKTTKIFVICLVIGILLSAGVYSIVYSNCIDYRNWTQSWHAENNIHEERAHDEYYDYDYDDYFEFDYYLENIYYCYDCDPAVSNLAYFWRESIFFLEILLPLSPLVASLLVAWIITAVKKSNGKKAEKKEKFKSTFNDFD